jgi:hypothetical protein
MDLTPDAQMHLAQRFADMLDQWGPFMALTVLVLIIYRKEIGALIMSMRRENMADTLLGQMNSSFAQNLEFFRKTVDDLDAIKASNQQIADRVDDATEVLGDIKDELIRRGR